MYKFGNFHKKNTKFSREEIEILIEKFDLKEHTSERYGTSWFLGHSELYRMHGFVNGRMQGESKYKSNKVFSYLDSAKVFIDKDGNLCSYNKNYNFDATEAIWREVESSVRKKEE
jgi:hypothetical protein